VALSGEVNVDCKSKSGIMFVLEGIVERSALDPEKGIERMPAWTKLPEGDECLECMCTRDIGMHSTRLRRPTSYQSIVWRFLTLRHHKMLSEWLVA
jgi:hypothetical protein